MLSRSVTSHTLLTPFHRCKRLPRPRLRPSWRSHVNVQALYYPLPWYSGRVTVGVARGDHVSCSIAARQMLHAIALLLLLSHSQTPPTPNHNKPKSVRHPRTP